ncbi:MAG: DNA translocase FtsK [Bdellovibrionales bacterium]
MMGRRLETATLFLAFFAFLTVALVSVEAIAQEETQSTFSSLFNEEEQSNTPLAETRDHEQRKKETGAANVKNPRESLDEIVATLNGDNKMEPQSSVASAQREEYEELRKSFFGKEEGTRAAIDKARNFEPEKYERALRETDYESLGTGGVFSTAAIKGTGFVYQQAQNLKAVIVGGGVGTTIGGLGGGIIGGVGGFYTLGPAGIIPGFLAGAKTGAIILGCSGAIYQVVKKVFVWETGTSFSNYTSVKDKNDNFIDKETAAHASFSYGISATLIEAANLIIIYVLTIKILGFKFRKGKEDKVDASVSALRVIATKMKLACWIAFSQTGAETIKRMASDTAQNTMQDISGIYFKAGKGLYQPIMGNKMIDNAIEAAIQGFYSIAFPALFIAVIGSYIAIRRRPKSAESLGDSLSKTRVFLFGKDIIKPNLWRGLIRVCVVLNSFWALFWLYKYLEHINQGYIYSYHRHEQQQIEIFFLGLSLPFASMIVWILIVWVWRGFLSDAQSPSEPLDALKIEDLYLKAIKLVREEKKASIAFIQNNLQTDYDTADKIVERMEKEGIVSTADHMGRREIL